MALEDILCAMEQQAQEEIAQLKAHADAEAATIISNAERAVSGIKTRHLHNIMPRLQSERARLLSEARLTALHEVMAAREALLQEAFSAAHAELQGLRENPQYPQYMAQLMREVVDELGPEVCVVIDARDAPLVRRLAAEIGATVQIATGLQTVGGLEASTPDGSISVINTMEARLERSQRYLRREVAAILSAEDVSWKATMAMPMPVSGP